MISPKLTYALEGEQKQADLHSIFVHQGFEYRPAEEIALRFGNDRSRFSAGIGIYMNNFALDYAFVGKESNGLGDESRVSLGVNF